MKVKCEICDKEFITKAYFRKHGWGRFCTLACKNIAARRSKELECYVCGKKVVRQVSKISSSKSGKFFCSKSCQTVWRNGYYSREKHSQWKGGFHRKYRDILMKENRRVQCFLCGINDERVLVVHHKDRNRSNNVPTNLTWLCHNCHYKVHHNKMTKLLALD